MDLEAETPPLLEGIDNAIRNELIVNEYVGRDAALHSGRHALLCASGPTWVVRSAEVWIGECLVQ